MAWIIQHTPGGGPHSGQTRIFHCNRLNTEGPGDGEEEEGGEEAGKGTGPPPMQDEAEGRGEEQMARAGQETEGVHLPH